MSEIVRIGEAWRAGCEKGRVAALATVIRTSGSTFRRPGARMLIFDDGSSAGSVSGGCLEGSVIAAAAKVIDSGESTILRYDGARDDVLLGEGTMCDGEVVISVERVDGDLTERLADLPDEIEKSDFIVEVRDSSDRGPRTSLSTEPTNGEGSILFRERVQAPFRLLLCGAGALAAATARLADSLAWRPVVVDHRPHFLRMMESETSDGSRPLNDLVRSPSRCAIVVMTHHYERDLEYVEQALEIEPSYTGLLGSRSRGERIVDELRSRGIDAGQLHTPAGLDLGSETIEEMALSIISEIQSVRRATSAGPLRASAGPVHGRGSARIAAILLAAGSSSRMGTPKLLLEAEDGDTMITRAMRNLEGLELSDIVVVEGAFPEIGNLARARGIRTVRNDNYEEGLSGSIRRGVESLGDEIDAVMIVLADQPRIRRVELARLVEAWRASDTSIVATRYEQGGGTPAIFSRTHFDELTSLQGDEGARELIRCSRARLIEVDDTRDVDSPSDLSQSGF